MGNDPDEKEYGENDLEFETPDAPELQSEQDQEEQDPAEENVVEPPRLHAEASVIVFTRVYDEKGNEWSLTLREGVTGEQVEHIFKAMKGSRKYAKKYGFGFERIPAPTPPSGKQEYELDADGRPAPAPVRKPPIGGPPPATKTTISKPRSGSGSDVNKEAIGRIQITPGNDPANPRIQFFSANPNLKFAVLSAPANIVASKLEARYGIEPDELSWLYEMGKEWTVNWEVQVVLSDKLNAKGNPYKNIGDLIDNDRE